MSRGSAVTLRTLTDGFAAWGLYGAIFVSHWPLPIVFVLGAFLLVHIVVTLAMAVEHG